MNLLLVFILANIINVIIQTAKSIITIRAGKIVAALVNALAYGFYTWVVILMVCDLPLLWKAGVVAACNLVGVFVVKYIEEKVQKDKLWKCELTVPTQYKTEVDKDFSEIPHSYIELSDKHTLFNFYCATQKQSREVQEIVRKYDAKYFVAESKNLF